MTWTPEAITLYLEAPRKIVPGTKMSFAGVKNPDDRENVVAYIEGFSATE